MVLSMWSLSGILVQQGRYFGPDDVFCSLCAGDAKLLCVEMWELPWWAGSQQSPWSPHWLQIWHKELSFPERCQLEAGADIHLYLHLLHPSCLGPTLGGKAPLFAELWGSWFGPVPSCSNFIPGLSTHLSVLQPHPSCMCLWLDSSAFIVQLMVKHWVWPESEFCHLHQPTWHMLTVFSIWEQGSAEKLQNTWNQHAG